MGKLIIYLTIGALLSSCGNNSEQSESPNEQADHKATSNVKLPEFEEGKVYPFMELKELYDQDWQGEAKGNVALDGKTTTIEGEVFSNGKMSKLVDDEVKLVGAKLRFRGTEFTDPDFGHDVECEFPAEMAEEIIALEEGANVTVTGVIEKQELYIEPNLTYTILSLKDCQLIQK